VTMTAAGLAVLVPAELGTWAGAVGAAVHGAEQAVMAGDRPRTA